MYNNRSTGTEVFKWYIREKMKINTRWEKYSRMCSSREKNLRLDSEHKNVISDNPVSYMHSVDITYIWNVEVQDSKQWNAVENIGEIRKHHHHDINVWLFLNNIRSLQIVKERKGNNVVINNRTKDDPKPLSAKRNQYEFDNFLESK